jgi:hypothetical protein
MEGSGLDSAGPENSVGLAEYPRGGSQIVATRWGGTVPDIGHPGLLETSRPVLGEVLEQARSYLPANAAQALSHAARASL